MSSREAFENVVGKVVEDYKAEIMMTLEKTYKDSLGIVEDMARVATVEAAEIARSEDRQAEALRKRILLGAELEARTRSLKLVEDIFNNIFEDFLNRLANLSSDKGYGASLKRLLEEGLDAIGGDEFVIYANSSDADLLKRITYEVEKSRKVRIKLSTKTLSCKGGVRISNNDGSVMYDNTLEMRLERLKPLLRKQLSNILKK